MAVSAFSRRILLLIGVGVALPALMLAGFSLFLTVRIGEAVEEQSTRFNLYIARQIAEALEQDLLAQLRESIAPAENGARNGVDLATLRSTLDVRRREFLGPHVVPLDGLTDYMLLIVESQPLVYGPDVPGADQHFAGVMLRDGRGQVLGAGGWWLDVDYFLRTRLRPAITERLAANPRIYGGSESIRYLSVALLGPDQVEVARVREPGDTRTAATDQLAGPFEGYTVRVGPTRDAPVMLTARFVTVEIAFIVLMGLVILIATLFGLRYTIRQLELARIKSGFVSNVSHELKTPISLSRIAVETLEMRRYSSPEEGEKFLRRISRETMRLNQLVDNILDFARLEAGQRVFKFVPVDVADLVRETLDSFRLRLEEQGFTLSVDLADDLPAVRGDGPAIAQCLLNLLDNAIKYSRNRREVTVAATHRDGAVHISVSDRGIGIPVREQQRIFEKFVRLETGLVHDVKGAGLGLSLVDQIIRAHGGRVEVHSTPGEGSTFTLVLPAAGGEEAERSEPRAQTGS